MADEARRREALTAQDIAIALAEACDRQAHHFVWDDATLFLSAADAVRGCLDELPLTVQETVSAPDPPRRRGGSGG